MKLSEFPQTLGFGPTDWRSAFDRRSAEFYRPIAGTGLRVAADPISADDVAEVTALVPLSSGEPEPSRFAATLRLVDGRYAALSARCDDEPHLRWTLGEDSELVLVSGLDYAERSTLLVAVAKPEMAADLEGVTTSHPAASYRPRGRRGVVPKSALAQLELARDLLVALAPLLWLTDDGELMVAETVVAAPAEAIVWLRQLVSLDD